MHRRTLLKRIGATGLASAALAGHTAAKTADSSYGIDREIDVTDVSGRVTLEELLEPGDLADLADDVDPAAKVFEIAEDTDAIVLDNCCVFCCADRRDDICTIECDCCECTFDC